MRSYQAAILSVLALVGAASPAGAQTVGDKADARCVLVLAVAAQDPKNKEAANTGSFFYLGRLNAHGLSAKLGATLIAESKTITSPDQVKAELARCGNELNARGGEMRAAMGQLQQAGKAAAAKKTPPPK